MMTARRPAAFVDTLPKLRGRIQANAPLARVVRPRRPRLRGLVHGLVDLWVKGNVALLQALLAGPRGGTEAGQSGISTLRASEPLPSEVVVVPAQPYARRLEAKGPFTRVGLDKRTIPRSCIAFTPEVLDANETEFQIHLKEFRFVGANYTGTVVLTGEPTAASGPAPDEQVVIVGL